MSDVFVIHDRRAAYLLENQPHAGELLTFYRHVLVNQKVIFTRLTSGRHSGLRMTLGQGRQLDLAALPYDGLVGMFHEFIAAVREQAPSVTADVGAVLLTGKDPHALRTFIDRDRKMDRLDEATRIRQHFYPRAFLQPVLMAILNANKGSDNPSDGAWCPVCGEPPQISMFQDETDGLGQRRLVCSLCSVSWRFPRVTCAHCGESSAEKLNRHEDESMPHVAVEECTSCHHYIKSVDLRRDGHAVPLVDDIATVAMDLWARERGWHKIMPNVLGL